ncbi:hypothetical protein LWI29_030749 [Acer saccharum]|uniref:Uncharacterized protein n=1 Tax=Acer saccharum TaxID=4024 RepID=A0AA39RUA7_ACESA|nr:hypothetical protein LWI29_030749 [Acer saccharum]
MAKLIIPNVYKSLPWKSEFPTDETLLDKLVGEAQKCVDKFELRGIIVEHNNSHNNSVENIHDLMDNICKKGNFKSLKYTCWKDDIATDRFTYLFNYLYMDEYESEDEDEEREDEDLEREEEEDSERKVHTSIGLPHSLIKDDQVPKAVAVFLGKLWRGIIICRRCLY